MLKPVVVLDTNVFVSGLISITGIPGTILQRFRLRHFKIVTSTIQIKEIIEVLKRPSLGRALPKGTTKEVLRFFIAFKRLTTVLDPPCLSWDFKDPDDHFLLDLAVYSKANFLITGDKNLKSIYLVGQCAVVSPIEFIARLI